MTDPAIAPNAFPIDGYVWASQPANPSYLATTGYEQNSSCGAIRVTRSATGVYQVRFYGMAGEFGHITIEPKGALCGCGNYGCLEQYASATAVMRMAKESIASGKSSGPRTR